LTILPGVIRRTATSCWSFSHIAEAMGVVSDFRCSEDWLWQFTRRNDIHLGRSLIWHDEEQNPLGLALLGVRGNQGWVGAFGLAPPCRGRGLAKDLLGEALQSLRTASVKRVTLEVADVNDVALKVYQRAGFQTQRRLEFLDGPAASPGGLVEAQAVDPGRLPGSPGLAWNRAVDPRYCQALCWGESWVKLRLDGDTCYLMDSNVPQHAEEITRVLQSQFPQQRLTALNEPVDSPLHAALLQHGWRVRLRQQEMTLVF
jgi:GNAT superfamily N-acetyltransferase